MLALRKPCIIFFLFAVFLTACAPPTPLISGTSTPRLNNTENVSATDTPAPAESSLEVEKEALRGVKVDVWHPWFGAEASLFQSQVAQFNTENEWGIIVSGQSQGNFSELFLQTTAAVENSSSPQIAIGLPEYALEWQEHIVDLTPYVSDPVYGLSSADVSDFPEVIWNQDETNGKRFGVPAQRTARFLLYNESWARELGFESPPATPAEFEQ